MDKQPDFDPADLPQESTTKKEIFQHPQTADTGKPLEKDSKRNTELSGKEAERSSKEEGFNEVNSTSTAGPDDGPDDQS